MSKHDKRVEQIIANRKRYCEALRSRKYTKNFFTLVEQGDASKVCALGVHLIETYRDRLRDLHTIPTFFLDRPYRTVVGCDLGLTRDQVKKIEEKNDVGGYSFKQIAEYVESLPIYLPETT